MVYNSRMSHGGGGGGLQGLHSKLYSIDDAFGINIAYILVPLGLGLMLFTAYWIGIPAGRWIGFAFWTSPVWLPYLLFGVMRYWWFEYINLYFDLQQGRTTLELQFPQEMLKSPVAMEIVLTYLYQAANPDNLVETYWDGKRPPRFGLEICSFEGKVRFFISTPVKKVKNMWEAQLYAHFPGIVITELEHDYTGMIPWDTSRYSYFSLRFGLKRPDILPIKTYIDYGLDKDPKEEYKIDPLASLIEFLSYMKKGEYLWVQLRIYAHREEIFKTGSMHPHADWVPDIKAKINELLQRDKDGKGAFETESSPRVSPGERELVAALERNASKFAFNAGLRVMYIAENASYNPSERISAIISMWRPFEDKSRNGIGMKWRTDFDWNWWQDPTGRRRLSNKKKEFREYKLRYFNKKDRGDKPFVLSTEEIATLFHPVGEAVRTPTLERIPSSRSEPPANLPRGTL